MRLTYVGMMGLVFGLAVYGCSDDGGSSGGATGGTDTGGGDTGGSDTGGGDSGGSGGSGGSTGGTGGSMGGMGGEAMGGMGGDVGMPTLEEACADRCETYVGLGCSGIDDQEACEQECLADAEAADELGCGDEYHAYVACESQDSEDGFQCFQNPITMDWMVEQSLTTQCEDARFDYWDCEDAAL